MRTVWRLVTARYVRSAFSGEGARLYGGRWNRKGIPVVYTSGSLSLAMLEMAVQDEPLRARYFAIPARIPDAVGIARVKSGRLPSDWRDVAARELLQAIGVGWIKKGASAVLAVPSAVVPTETNYLLNPEHSDFSKIEIGRPVEVLTDRRLRRRLRLPG
jgi:RES domain-containing protein